MDTKKQRHRVPVTELVNYDAAVIVAGSRCYNDYYEFSEFLKCYLAKNHTGKRVVFITGMASKGADALIIRWVNDHENDNDVPYKWVGFPADWDKHKGAAGYIRNCDMAKHGTHLYLFWDGNSKGSAHMLTESKKNQLVWNVVLVEKDPDEDAEE